MTTDKINIIVFSKDRACQLDLHLKSLAASFKEFKENEVSVVYDFSNMDFLEGYQKLMETTPPNVKFYTDNQLGSLKETLLHLTRTDNIFTMYLCDDIIFVNPFSLADKEIQIVKTNSAVMSTSLRLWKGIDFCYATNSPSPAPSFIDEFCWDWRQTTGDWGYPMSCDGNIYLTEFLKRKTQAINFVLPNHFEAGLAGTADPSYPLTSCYLSEPKLINIPANVVQHAYANRHGNLKTAAVLNEMWLRDMQLDLDFYVGKKFNTVHVELELKFKE
jgi:hypothetical protein